MGTETGTEMGTVTWTDIETGTGKWGGGGGGGEPGNPPKLMTVVVVVDSHIQRIVLATGETTVTQQVSHRPIKFQSRSWSRRGTKVNGSHDGDNSLLRPTGIQIATKFLPGPSNREHPKLIVKTLSLGIKFQSRSWSRRGTKVNGSHGGDNSLLRPTGIQIATKFLPGPSNREHPKLIVKTLSLGMNYSFYCLKCRQYFRI